MELKDVINVIYLIHPVEFDTTWQACMSHHFFLLQQITLRFFKLPEAKLSLFHKMPHSTAMGWLMVSLGWLRTMAHTWTHYLFPNSTNEESYKGESMCLAQNTTTAWQSWVQKRTTRPWSTVCSSTQMDQEMIHLLQHWLFGVRSVQNMFSHLEAQFGSRIAVYTWLLFALPFNYKILFLITLLGWEAPREWLGVAIYPLKLLRVLAISGG